MQISNSIYLRLKSRLKRRYETQFIKSVNDLKNFPHSKTAKWVIEHQDDLQVFTPQRWFFLKQLEALFFFLSQEPEALDEEFFSKADNEIFERWNQSEFADTFLKLLNKQVPLRKASLITAKVLDEHLLVLGNIHLLRKQSSTKNYRLHSSLGDIKKQNKISKLLETTLHLDGKELSLLTASLKEMKKFSNRIEVATKVIKKFSPDSWARFSAFTDAVIPIKQKELVSYSHQDLPGVSMINLYHRDFVDLLDDLLHENGHHHLNYYLNLGTLIEEPIDCIYYSPWRRTLRPLRGIYHAYFTFFWAFKLFSDMLKSNELDSIWYMFSDAEKEKITWRAVEEYWMLDYVYQDLKWAKKNGLISKVGWDLIQEQKISATKLKTKIIVWEKSLKLHKKDLKDLKRELSVARKKYQL